MGSISKQNILKTKAQGGMLNLISHQEIENLN